MSSYRKKSPKDNSVAEWLGILGSDSIRPGDQIPAWRGVDRSMKTLNLIVLATASFTIFKILDSNMPQDDGLGGYAPMIMATSFYAIARMASERYLLRFE